MSINGNPNVANVWREMPRQKNKPTLNLKKLTLAEKKIEISWVDKSLNILAAPYRHETGFYFRGKKTFTNQKCALCSVFIVVFVLSLVLVLFAPIFKGTIVQNEMIKSPFSTPGSVPLYNRKDGKKSSDPGALARLFGREAHRPLKHLNISAFIDQFRQIDVYGANSCDNRFNVKDGSDSFI